MEPLNGDGNRKRWDGLRDQSRIRHWPGWARPLRSIPFSKRPLRRGLGRKPEVTDQKEEGQELKLGGKRGH